MVLPLFLRPQVMYLEGMSIIPPGISRNLQFYLSGPLPCPYLPAQVERKLFTRLDSRAPDANSQINAALCRAGFRRSHDIVYRPACNACSACIPVRIPSMFFAPSKSLRRTSARNKDLSWERIPTRLTVELFALFSAYQKGRHADSDMAQMSEADFSAMLEEGQAGTQLFALRDPARALKGCIIADPVGDGFSAVYSFFDPTEADRSLGTQLILSLVIETQNQNLPFVYLGYWVKQSRKMAYKERFKPLQILTAQGWDWL